MSSPQITRMFGRLPAPLPALEFSVRSAAGVFFAFFAIDLLLRADQQTRRRAAARRVSTSQTRVFRANADEMRTMADRWLIGSRRRGYVRWLFELHRATQRPGAPVCSLGQSVA